ncbi:transcriptional regulator [Halobacteriales archaeon SW_7_65_23]|nr:MAG: transcriptional regulator [Halobacteriales archaeon SW_7_65_23]
MRFHTRATGDAGSELPLLEDCESAFRDAQRVVGRKWHPIIVYHLLDAGPLGFSELKDRVDDVSSKMLAESLDDLQAAGLLEREQVREGPTRVEYSLTERGAALEPLLVEMLRWGTTHGPVTEADR